MDKSVDLFMATFLLLVIFILTMLATNFILSNLFKKLDEVYALTTVKSIVTSWGFNPGYPPDVIQTDSKDPVWQYGGFAYAEFRPIVNYDLKIVYTPPVRVYYGVIDPMKLYHLNVFAMENDYVTLRRFLGIPMGNEFNLYVEMPAPLEVVQTNNFWNITEYFEKNYVDSRPALLLLREMDSPYKYMKGDIILAGVKCGDEYCIPLTDNVVKLHESYLSGENSGSETSLLSTENLHYYGVSFGIIPYKGTSLEYIINVYQDFLSMAYAVHRPKITFYVTGDFGNRVEIGTETAYPLYSRYLNIMNPDYSREFPQFTLMRLDMLLSNVAYKPEIYNERNAHLLIRFIYMPLAYYSSNKISQELNDLVMDIEKKKPFDMMLQVMFIPDVEKPSQVKVKEVVTVIEQEDLGLTIKKTFKPNDQSNFFYVFTYHWEPYLKEKGYTMDDICNVAKNYDHKVPLNIRVYVKYEYQGEEYVKAYSFKIKVWEQQDENFLVDTVNTIYRALNSIFHPIDYFEAESKVDKLYELYYRDVGIIDVLLP